jgi:hypothetical protein
MTADGLVLVHRSVSCSLWAVEHQGLVW